MKRSLIGLLAVALLLLLGSAGTLQAAPLNQAAPTAASWGVGALLRVKSTVPFVWLRRAPSPAAGVLDTAPQGDYLVVAGQTALWDGVQWWWRVRRGNIIGYVEQESMELIIAAPTSTAPSASPTPSAVPPPSATPRPHQTTQATWLVGTLLRVSASVPFAWLRTAPSPSGQPFDTLVPGTTVIVVGANPQWDSVQWWWQVRRANGGIVGYVEQDSLELVSGPATGTVAATSAATAITPGAATAVPPAAWGFGTLHSVKSTVPFAWVRTDPSSTGGIEVTIYPGWLVLIRNATPTWDGTQWWWQISVPARGIVGWIEQNSLL